MRMARRCGLDVAEVELTRANGKDVLLVERFDRVRGTRQRRPAGSALTMLGIPETAPREASYGSLAEVIRERFTEPRQTLRELFSRITYNILCGNTDDHARDHAAFWDGRMLTLTPAYDICSYLRGRRRSHASNDAWRAGRPVSVLARSSEQSNARLSTDSTDPRRARSSKRNS